MGPLSLPPSPSRKMGGALGRSLFLSRMLHGVTTHHPDDQITPPGNASRFQYGCHIEAISFTGPPFPLPPSPYPLPPSPSRFQYACHIEAMSFTVSMWVAIASIAKLCIGEGFDVFVDICPPLCDAYPICYVGGDFDGGIFR